MAEVSIALKLKDLASQGLQKVTDSAKGLADGLDKISAGGPKLTNLGNAISLGVTGPIVAAAGALGGLITATAIAADSIDKMSERTGISRKSLQELQYAAGQTGVDFKAIDGISAGFSGRLLEIEKGTGSASRAFASLGLSTKSSTGDLKASGQVFEETLQAIASIADPAERSAAAIALLGPEGAKLAPLLNQGAEGMANLRQRANELGVVLSDDAIQGFVLFGDAMADIKTALAGLRNDIASQFVPILRNSLVPLINGTVVPAIRQFSVQVAALISWFLELSAPVQRFIIGATGIVAAIGPAITIVGRLATTFGTLATTIRTVVIPSLVAIRTAALGPLLPVFAAVAGAIALFTLAWRTNFGDIQGIVSRAIEFVGRVLRNLPAYWDASIFSVKQFVEAFSFQFRTMGEILVLRLGIIRDGMSLGLESFKQVFFDAFASLISGVQSFVEDISVPLNQVADFFGAQQINTSGFLSGFRGFVEEQASGAASAVEAAEGRIWDAQWSIVGLTGQIATAYEVAKTNSAAAFAAIEDVRVGAEGVNSTTGNGQQAVEDYAAAIGEVGVSAGTTAENLDSVKTLVTELDTALAGTQNYADKIDVRTRFGLDDALSYANELEDALSRLYSEVQELAATPNLYETFIGTDADGNQTIEFVNQDTLNLLDNAIERFGIIEDLRNRLFGEATESFVPATLEEMVRQYTDSRRAAWQSAVNEEFRAWQVLEAERAENLENFLRNPVPSFVPNASQSEFAFPPLEGTIVLDVEIPEPDLLYENLKPILATVQSALNEASLFSEVFGDGFDLAAAQTNIYRRAVEELVQAGAGVNNPYVLEYLERYNTLIADSPEPSVFERMSSVVNDQREALSELLDEFNLEKDLFGAPQSAYDYATAIEVTKDAIRELAENFAGEASVNQRIKNLTAELEELERQQTRVAFDEARDEIRETAQNAFALEDALTKLSNSLERVIVFGDVNIVPPIPFEDYTKFQNTLRASNTELLANQQNINILENELKLLFDTYGAGSDEVNSFINQNSDAISSLYEQKQVLESVARAGDIVFEDLQRTLVAADGISDSMLAVRLQIVDLDIALKNATNPDDIELLTAAIAILEAEFNNLGSEIGKEKTLKVLGEWKSAISEASAFARDLMEEFGASDEAIKSVELLGNAVNDAFSAATSFASGDIIGGITATVRAIFGIFQWLRNLFKSEEQKAAEEAAAAWSEFVQGLRASFESAIRSGLSNAMKEFAMGNYETQKDYDNALTAFRESFRENVYSAVLDGIIEALIQKAVIEAALGPYMELIAQAATDGNWDMVRMLVREVGGITENIINQMEPIVEDLYNLKNDFFGTDLIGKPVIDFGPIKDVEDSVNRVINDYTSALDKTENAASEFGQFASSVVSIPLYDASIRFSDSVDRFGNYINGLISQGISVTATSHVTVNNAGIPAYN